MTTYTGQEGVVKVGDPATAVGETTEFSVESSAETQQATAQRDKWHRHKPGIKGWNGSATANFSDDDGGQAELTLGSVVDLSLYPMGDAQGKELSGTAIVTGVNTTSPMEGIVTKAFTFQGTGPLAEEAVAT